MTKKTIIIPYFGKFPKFFQLFLDSCGNNKDFKWLIFTDNDIENYEFPKNVKKISMSFKQLKKLIQSKLDFTITLDSPYKLCDYKVAYGLIFSDWLKYSDWWGFSDCDVIFGNLSKLIKKDTYDRYEKIFTTGHFSLFRNEKVVNKAFLSEYKGRSYAKKVLKSNKIYGFDEMIINDIFVQNSLRVYTLDISANISVYYYNFRIVRRDFQLYRYLIEEYVPAIYYCSENGVFRIFYNDDDGRYIKNEFIYIHLQQRNLPVFNCEDYKLNAKEKMIFQILPNKIIPITEEPSFENFYKFYKKGKISRLLFHCSFNLIKYKLKRFLSFMFRGHFLRGNY